MGELVLATLAVAVSFGIAAGSFLVGFVSGVACAVLLAALACAADRWGEG